MIKKSMIKKSMCIMNKGQHLMEKVTGVLMITMLEML